MRSPAAAAKKEKDKDKDKEKEKDKDKDKYIFFLCQLTLTLAAPYRKFTLFVKYIAFCHHQNHYEIYLYMQKSRASALLLN